MRYKAFATDYDGTFATDGMVMASTLAALETLKASGRKTLLVTGRHLEDLQRVFIVNLMGVAINERPAAFLGLLPKILEIRGKTARPHLLVIDEAHHLMPPSWSPLSDTIPQELRGMILITVHPEHVSPAALTFVNTVLTTGANAAETLAAFAKTMQLPLSAEALKAPEPGQGWLWARAAASSAQLRAGRVVAGTKFLFPRSR